MIYAFIGLVFILVIVLGVDALRASKYEKELINSHNYDNCFGGKLDAYEEADLA